MHASPRETRRIGNNSGRQLEHLEQRLRRCVGKRLPKRLDAIEDTCCGASLNGDALTTDSKHITLLSCHLRRHGQLDIMPFLVTFLGNGDIDAYQITEVDLQKYGLLLQFRWCKNLNGSIESKGFSLLQGNALRQRHDVIIASQCYRSE